MGVGPAAINAVHQQPPEKVVGTDPASTKNAFLQLLVAQLRHQNPMNPADGVEFITQLTQFTSLEQMMSIRQELETIRQAVTAGADTK